MKSEIDNAAEIENAGFTFIAESYTGDYDWAAFTLWFKHGMYYWAEDSGCSCTSPWQDDKFPDDFTRGTRTDAIKAVNAWGWSDRERILLTLLDF